MLFAAMNVALGIMGRTSLEHSGKLKACHLLSFVVGLGREENGTLPGIAYNVTQCRSIRYGVRYGVRCSIRPSMRRSIRCEVLPFDTASGRSVGQLQVTLAGGRTT